jgi:type IV secretory pathway VirJ component
MAARPSRTREVVRRLAAGVVLTLAMGVGLGDDLKGTPDARRGARALHFDLPHLGGTPVLVPRAAPTGVVLLLHRGASSPERSALLDAVPWHVLLVDVDVTRLGDAGPASCTDAAALLEDISRRAQRDAGLTSYRRPVVVATAGALPLATAALAGSTDVALPAGVAVGRIADDEISECGDGGNSSTAGTRAERWRYAASPHVLGSPLEAALRAAAVEPRRDATPVQRWLRNFDLPLTAVWSSRPRAILALLSPARGWREPEEVLARRLADAGVHVVGIDALRSFWQRRSPRDVALELQRLTEALRSTGLPVYIGGRGFGAETMAVAGEMMSGSRAVAGVVLVDPGPTAFFEVEPPALARRPISPLDWSTRAAVQRLRLPTLCVAQGPDSPATLLCGSLAQRGQATLARTGGEASALAEAITRFVVGRMPPRT